MRAAEDNDALRQEARARALEGSQLILDDPSTIHRRVEQLGLTVWHSEQFTTDTDISFSGQLDQAFVNQRSPKLPPLFMPSKARAELSFLNLAAFGIDHRRCHAVIIEKPDLESYTPYLRASHLLIVLDHADQGIGFARATIRSFADLCCVTRFWMVDDNIQGFVQFDPTNGRKHVDGSRDERSGIAAR